MLQRLTSNSAGNVSIYQVCGQEVYLVYEARFNARPGMARLAFDGELARLVLTQVAATGRLRNFYGSNRFRTADGRWLPATKGNVTELLTYTNVFFAVGPAPIPETGVPAPNSFVQEQEDSIVQACAYLGQLQAGGLFHVSPPDNEWRDCLVSESPCIPEARGVLRHPIFPDGDAEGWLDERPPVRKKGPDTAWPHLRRLFSGVDRDNASRAILYSYLFAAFHKCSLNQPRPLLIVDSIEQGVGKSVTGEAIATLIDDNPKTLALDRNANEGDEIVSILAHGSRCLVLPNLAQRRNWNNTLLATLCTDIGQSRRMKYSAKATTFYGTLGITSAVLGGVSLHRDLVSRLWRVALKGKAQPSLTTVPQEYAKEHREDLQSEIMGVHTLAEVYTGRLSTRFTAFEAAGAAAYAVFEGISHREVAELMGQAEKARHFFRDEVMASLWRKHPEVFAEKLAWTGVGEGADWLKDYAGAHAFGFILSEDGKWQTV